MTIINLTPHAINMIGQDGSVVLSIPASGQLARCKATTVVTGSVNINGVEIPTTETVMGAVEGLPERQDGVLLITSLAVANEIPERDDVVIPNESVRDDQGAHHWMPFSRARQQDGSDGEGCSASGLRLR